MILGALAFGHEHARAQLGLDTLRSVVDKAKSGKSVPGKDVLKGKAAPNVKGQIQKGQATKGAISNITKNKGALEKFTKGDRAKDLIARDRLKDKFGKGPADKLTRDKLTDKFGKDRLTKDKLSKDALTKDKFGKGKLSKDALTKDKLGKDKLSKDALTKDKLGKDKLSKDALSKDKLGKDKLGKDKLGKDQLAKDKLGKDRLAQDKLGKDKLGKDKLGKDKLGKGKANDLQFAKGKTMPDKRASTRIAQAKNPVERGKVRFDHRREINVARMRLPPRPFPGTAGFSGVPPAGETRFVSTEMVFHVGPNVSRQAVDAQAKRLGLTVVGVQQSAITGGTLYQFGVPPGRQVSDVVRSLEAGRVGIASPNYVYRIVQDTAAETSSSSGSPDQYTVEKLKLTEVHKVATGREILVAAPPPVRETAAG